MTARLPDPLPVPVGINHWNGEPDVLIRCHQVLALYAPVCRTTWWRWIKEGKAPAPIRLGTRIVAWRKSDLAAWQASLSRAALPL